MVTKIINGVVVDYSNYESNRVQKTIPEELKTLIMQMNTGTLRSDIKFIDVLVDAFNLFYTKRYVNTGLLQVTLKYLGGDFCDEFVALVKQKLPYSIYKEHTEHSSGFSFTLPYPRKGA